MVKVIACWDKGWVDWKTDYQQWSHACRAFGAEFELVKNLEEFERPNASVVVLEEQGVLTLDDFIHPMNVVYIFGRSGMNGIQANIDYDHMVKIPVVDPSVCLFGITAVGIVLRDRMVKNGSHNI